MTKKQEIPPYPPPPPPTFFIAEWGRESQEKVQAKAENPVVEHICTTCICLALRVTHKCCMTVNSNKLFMATGNSSFLCISLIMFKYVHKCVQINTGLTFEILTELSVKSVWNLNGLFVCLKNNLPNKPGIE